MSTNPDHPGDLKFEVNQLISVLLPVYNAEGFLKGCLESIINQTYSNIEIVVVDDGSEDASSTILAQYSKIDSRFKLLSFDKNRGIVAALNAGLELCSGNWVARMDSDDVMHPERLEKQLSFCTQHPEIDILGAKIALFKKEGQLTPGQIKYQNWSNGLVSDVQIKSNIYAESPIMHPTFFLKKAFYEKMHGYQDLPWAEDYDFLLRAYLKGSVFGKLNEVLVEKGDHSQRLARIDKRCKRKAMFNAKGYYFSKDKIWDQKRRLIIIGTGSSGKMAFDVLNKNQIKVDGFVDHGKGPDNRKLIGLPVWTIDETNADTFFKQFKGAYYILCVGAIDGLKLTETLLNRQGLREVSDYIRFV